MGEAQMSNVIRMLETMGAQPAMTPGEYAAAVRLLDTDEAQRKALLERDADTLNALLGGRPRMICMIATPQEEDAPARAPDEQEDAPSEPDQKD
jgi:hypothetical protein